MIRVWLLAWPFIALSATGVAAEISPSPPPQPFPIDEVSKRESKSVDNRLPIAISSPTPIYTDFALNARIEGKVILNVLVGADGRVKKTMVLRSLPGLDEAAQYAVATWGFKPALSEGKPVSAWIEIPVGFKFPDRASGNPRAWRPTSLADPNLFRDLASERGWVAGRLEGLWTGRCDSLVQHGSSALKCFVITAEMEPRSWKGVAKLFELLAGCPWTRAPGWPPAMSPTLSFRRGADSLELSLVVSLAGMKAMLSRIGEGSVTASIPEALHTRVAWCLWGVDPENPKVLPEIQAVMRRRGLSPTDAPPPEIDFLDDFLPIARESEKSVSEGQFVYYEEQPTLVSAPPPTYSEFAREAQIEGKVILHVLVGQDGRVKSVKVIRSVVGLDDAAVMAVRKWVYKPAMSGNRPVAVWIEVPMTFPP